MAAPWLENRPSSLGEVVPIEEPKYKLTRSLVGGAPEGTGIYALWEDDELIYIGRANGVGIKAALLRHLDNGYCPCTRRASHYSWELSLRPATREVEVLERFQARHRRLPRCNEEAA
jgi:hypothetical protein